MRRLVASRWERRQGADPDHLGDSSGTNAIAFVQNVVSMLLTFTGTPNDHKSFYSIGDLGGVPFGYCLLSFGILTLLPLPHWNRNHLELLHELITTGRVELARIVLSAYRHCECLSLLVPLGDTPAAQTVAAMLWPPANNFLT